MPDHDQSNSRGLYLVMNNPVAGREQDFHRWYDERHLPEILQIPGFTSAQRFRLDSVRQGPDPYPYGYLTTYEISGDPTAAFEALRQTRRSGHMSGTSALESDQFALVYRPIGPRHEAATSPLRPPEAR